MSASTNLTTLLIELLTDHDLQQRDSYKLQREQERKVDRRAGELLCERPGLRSIEKKLADGLRQGELTRDHAGFGFPSKYFCVVDGEFRQVRPASERQRTEPSPPRIRSWLHEAIRSAEREFGLGHGRGLPWWLAEVRTPWVVAVQEVLRHAKCECDKDQIRQYVESARNEKLEHTSDLSRELARLNEQEGFVKKLLDKIAGRFPKRADEFRALATETTAQSSKTHRPRWGKDRRELRYDGKLCKQWKTSAPNQLVIINAFEEEGWRQRIDDPLPRGKLGDTLRQLNSKMSYIRFTRDGTGAGILWERRPESP